MIFIQLYTVKNRINIPQSFFFYNQNSLFDMLEGTIIDCRVFLEPTRVFTLVLLSVSYVFEGHFAYLKDETCFFTECVGLL